MEQYPNKYYEALASTIGITSYTKNGPFTGKKGTLIGEKSGYLVSVGLHQKENSSGVGILIRYKRIENFEMIRTTVHFSPALLTGLKIKELSDRHRKEFLITEDSFFWMWPYVFKKPAPELIAEMVETFISAVKQAAPGFDGKCERCAANTVTNISLFNSVPVYYCPPCQQAVKDEMGIAETEYDQRPSNLLKGILYGAAGALGGGAVWGVLSYETHTVFAAAAIALGVLVAWLTGKGVTKITVLSRILVGILTMLGIFFGDMLFATLTVMDQEQIPFSLSLLSEVMTHFTEIEFQSDNIPSLIFGVIGSVYAVGLLAKPNFKAQFESIS